jgi:macrolide transport system ATP-binding/permease protein
MDAFFRRLLYYFRRRQFEAELAEEMEHHAALSGQPKFGNVTLLKEDSRAMWTWTFVEQLGQDLRYALRTMANNKAFTALAALSLALGIGANTAIYSFMDSILLRTLPVQNPESLVMLNTRSQPRNASPSQAKGKQAKRESVMHSSMTTSGSSYNDPKTGFNGGVFPYPAFELFQKSDPIFSSVFAYYGAGPLNLTIKGQADVANGEYVSGDFFRGLGVPPAAGRLIAGDDDKAGAPAVAVVSYSFSQRRFGGAANAEGQSILINNVPFTVIGVAPPEFFGIDPAALPDYYLPMHANLLLQLGPILSANSYLDQNFYWIEIMARLRPGVSMEHAQATLAPQFHQWVLSTARNDGERADLPKLVIKEGAGGLDALRRQYSKPLYVLLTLVGLILAIACANIANLLLARATARQREMAVRLSMGAGRWRVIRQLLTESVLLASLGGALGILFAAWGIRVLTVLLANGRENFTLHAELNWHVLGVTIALSVLTGVLFGLAPAIQSTRVDVIPALKEARAGEQVRRSFLHVSLSQVLVVSQIAISLLMLVAAGLFVRTLSNLQKVDLGFNRENLLLFQLNARQAGHQDADIATFYSDLQKRFSGIPGVRSATLSRVPLVGGASMGTIITAGGEQQVGNLVLPVGPSFFTTMQIPMLLGREIEERDQPGSPVVAVVNELFAKAAFGDDNPIGRHINLVGPKRDIEIVGVSKTARYAELKSDNQPVVYIAYNQGAFGPVSQVAYELRTAGNPLNYVNSVREIVHQADARVPLSNVKTQAAQVDQAINQEIIFARLCTGFAILGLIIACVGLYGTMSYNVARRTNEIGIRMALGAQRGGVIWMVLKQVFALAIVGLAIGLPVALAASKLVESFLFGMKPDDPLAITVAVAVLIAAAVIAGYAPARRASKIDPMVALRHE